MRRRFDGLTAALRRYRALAGTLEPAIGHFSKVTRSYRPGLFHGYAVPGLPRTDNDLEQAFGPSAVHPTKLRLAWPLASFAQRYHERRATGRKGASPAAVLRGEVRLIAATATRMHEQGAADLARTPTGPRGGACAPAWTSAGRPAPCAPASGVIPKPTFENSKPKPSSQLC